MIELIKGEVIQNEDAYVILQTNGVGFKIWIPISESSLYNLGEITQLHIDLILRENDINRRSCSVLGILALRRSGHPGALHTDDTTFRGIGFARQSFRFL